MTPGETQLALVLHSVSGHPCEEIFVTADPEQAVIYFWSELAGAHVCCEYGTQYGGPVTVRPHRTEALS